MNNNKNIQNQNFLEVLLSKYELNPHEKWDFIYDENLNVQIFYYDENINKEFIELSKLFLKLLVIYHNFLVLYDHKEFDKLTEQIGELQNNFKNLNILISENKDKIGKFPEFISDFTKILNAKLILLNIYEIWIKGVFPIEFQKLLTSLEKIENDLNSNSQIMNFIFKTLRFEINCSKKILLTLYHIENYCFWNAFFSLTHLKNYLEIYEKQNLICKNCKISQYYFFSSFHFLLRKKIFFLFPKVYNYLDNQNKEDELKLFLKNITESLSNACIIIFAKKESFNQININSKLEFVNQFSISINELLTYKNYSVIFSTKENFEFELNEIIEFLEESNLIETYLNKSGEKLRKNNEFDFRFAGKISNNWYFGFYARNFRKGNDIYKIDFFVKMWRNKEILSFEPKIKKGNILD